METIGLYKIIRLKMDEMIILSLSLTHSTFIFRNQKSIMSKTYV